VEKSGFRTIVVYQQDNKAIFLYGFEKNEKGNTDSSESNTSGKAGGLKTVNRSKRAYLFTT